MFPSDSISVFNEVCGNGTFIGVSGNDQKTALGVALQQENNSSDTEIMCGGIVIAKNYATNFSHVPMNYKCDSPIYIKKTGQDCVSSIITYIPYYSNSATSTYNPSTNISSTTDIKIYGSFSAGEILISLLIFLLIIYKIGESIVQGLSVVKTQKRFLQYNGGDVEIRNDL